MLHSQAEADTGSQGVEARRPLAAESCGERKTERGVMVAIDVSEAFQGSRHKCA